MSPASERRAAHNEDLFRRLNERLHVLASIADRASARVDKAERCLCECSQANCSRVIELTAAQYRSVRAGDRRFLVFPDPEHTDPEVERVVERHDNYWVVEKTGPAGAEAAALADSEAEPL